MMELIEFFCWVIGAIVNAVFTIITLLFIFCLTIGFGVILFKLGQFVWINTTNILEANNILEYLNHLAYSKYD